VCVANLKKEYMDFVKNSNTDKEVQIGHNILAFVVLDCVVELNVQDLRQRFTLLTKFEQRLVHYFNCYIGPPGSTELNV